MSTHSSKISRNPFLLFTLLCVGVVLVWGIPKLMMVVPQLGNNLPSPDVAKDYVAAWTWAVLIGISILFWPIPRAHRFPLLCLWALRTFVTLGVMLVYESFYQGLDAYADFQDGLNEGWKNPVLSAGTAHIIHSVYWLGGFIGPDYHLVKVSFSLIGLLGSYAYYRAACSYMERDSIFIMIVLGAFPSIIFWSSIIGKDPVTFLGTGLYMYGTVQYQKRPNFGPLLWMLAGAAVAAWIRPWLLIIFAVPQIVLLSLGIRSLLKRIVSLLLALGGMTAAANIFVRYFHITSIASLLADANSFSRSWAIGGSGQKINVDFTSIGSVIAFLPKGAFAALYRPLPGEIPNIFGTVAGIECSILLFLTIIACVRFRREHLREPMVLWALTFIGVWVGFYGLISYQNLGNAVRFRLQVLPILLLLLLRLMARRKHLGGMQTLVTGTSSASSPMAPSAIPQ